MRIYSWAAANSSTTPSHSGVEDPSDFEPKSQSNRCADHINCGEPRVEHERRGDIHHDIISGAFLNDLEPRVTDVVPELEEDAQGDEECERTEHKISGEVEINGSLFFQPFDDDCTRSDRYAVIGSDDDETDSNSYGSSDSEWDGYSVATESSCAGEEEHPLQEGVVQEENAVTNGHDMGSFGHITQGDLDGLLRSRRKRESRFMLTAMVSVVGSLRYTVHDYDFCRDIVNEAFPGSGMEWPTYSKVHKNFKEVMNTCFPTSQLVELPRKRSHLLRHSEKQNPQSGRGDHSTTESVRIFLPSAWAKLDIATSVVFRQMYPEEGVSGGILSHLERSSAVQEREIFTSACDQIMIPFRGENVACGSGSLINICL